MRFSIACKSRLFIFILYRSRFYYITYEVDSPIKLRYNNYIHKYKTQSHYTLEQFVELDDLIKFNNTDFSVCSSDATYTSFIKRKFYNRFQSIKEFHAELNSFKFDD